jgi:hypothetical protein
MNLGPSWLPPMVSVSGEWNKIIIILYKIFQKDFQYGKLYFRCYIVIWDKHILPGNLYEEGFWHLITKEDIKARVRFPDFRRAERLPWCAPIIRNSEDPVVKTWDSKERGKIRTYLWLGKMDYVVVLEKRKNKKKAVLVTAYYVEGESTRRRLMQKYNSRFQ